MMTMTTPRPSMMRRMADAFPGFARYLDGSFAMKYALAVSAILLASPSYAAEAPQGSGKCIETWQIDHTKAPDDKTIIFYMKDRSAYQSTLQSVCPELRINGFSYVATPPAQICGGLQSIRVLRTGSVCLLGPLVPITPSSSKGG